MINKTQLIAWFSIILSIIGFWVIFYFYPSFQLPQIILRICFSFCTTIIPLYIIILVLAVWNAMKDENVVEEKESVKKVQPVKIYGSNN